MSQLAVEYNAVNLGQGFPDFGMAPELTDLVSKAMKDGMNQYAPMAGLPLLRDRIAEKVEKLYHLHINPGTEVTITPGGTYAIYTALTSVLQPGDEVIVFEPAYDSYIPNIITNGATPVLIPLEYPAYNIPWQKVREKINAKTRLIIINSPHNPTGSVLTPADMEQLKQITTGTNIFIVSDEVYEHLIFDGIRHESILRYPELFNRSFVCFSFGKTYHCTGWKLGYCIAPAALTHEFRKIHQYNCFTCFTPAQVALAEYLLQENAYLHLGEYVQKKRDYFQELMKATPFLPLSSHGSYFQCYSFRHLSDEKDTTFATRLTTDFGVTTIPVSAFYNQATDDGVLRFCFCKKEETLEKAVEKLATFA